MAKTTRGSDIHLYTLSFMAFLLVLLIVIATVPQWRQSLRDALVSPERNILASVSSDLARTGAFVRVIKVREGRSLFLEVYEELPTGAPLRLDRQPLAGSKNAYFTFRGESTSLALYDLDHDGTLEIITPTFEGGLTPRMNVFKFQPRSKKLLELKEVALPDIGQNTGGL